MDGRVNDIRHDDKAKGNARGLQHIVYYITAILSFTIAAACANIGSPDGGAYDEKPPVVLSCTPANQAVNNERKKISIYFNEYIKIENASEKVVVSPPQTEAPNVRADGKRVRIDLFDTLKANTTYTVDFSDAIVDNNEGNPMGNFTYSFSTGPDIDTMEVSGYVLNAEDLEPVKGILVGLYEDGPDSLFTTQPLQRVARTNGSGHFVIKGVAANRRYRAYALQDMDGNFRFTQKSEALAFDTMRFETSCRPDVRLDTIWADSTHYDSIHPVRYTHFYPDDIVLRAFKEGGQDRHLLKTQRDVPEKFSTFFTAPADSLPILHLTSTDNDSCIVTEANLTCDTITYWITDTTVAYADTLSMLYTYLDTDTLGVLVWKTDTLELMPKTTRAKQLKQLQEKTKEWEKEQKKKRKRNPNLPPEENPHLVSFLAADSKPSGSIDPNLNPVITFSEPLTSPPDSLHIRFTTIIDSVEVDVPYLLEPVEGAIRSYQLFAEWELGTKYTFTIDSASVTGVLGHINKAIKYDYTVRKAEEYGTLFIHVNLPDSNVIVQLLNASDKPVRTMQANSDGRADFYYLRPGDYYLRCFIDRNGNGHWDTGEYASGTAPEETFYFPKPLTVKAQWDVEQEWDVRGIPLMRQKPEKITKQKPDKAKQQKNRNKDRDAAMQRESRKRMSGNKQ